MVAESAVVDQTLVSIELGLEYDPEPPFSCGHPDRAPAATVELVTGLLEPAVEAHRSKARHWRSAIAHLSSDVANSPPWDGGH